jgi:hypothetical protein
VGTSQPAAAVPVTTPVASATFGSAPTPTISGTAKVGSTLTAVTGTWAPVPSFSFQWTRNGVSISGATAPTYKLVAADGGQTIRVVVKGTKSGYTTVVKTSTGVKPPRVFTSTPNPGISGTAKTGSVLTATTGTWSPTPTTFSFQWKKNGTAISGATSSTYTVRPTDVDATLTVTVMGAKSGYTSVARTSSGKLVVGVSYPNCAALNVAYPHGVARLGVTGDKVSGVMKPLGAQTFFSTTLYNLNTSRDGDKDGIACEKH